MIVSRTPLRISFVGGGSDLPGWYRQHGGAVVSTAIRQHVTILVKPLAPFHPHRYRVAYSRTELAPSRDAIEHPLVREALRLLDIDEPLEIVSVSDVPAGTGLGSSSSFTVGLLHALHAYRGERPCWEQLAEEACTIEIERLGEPIGKQDQTIAAAGGLRHIRFLRDGRVEARTLAVDQARLDAFEAHLLAFYTGGQRRAGSVLGQLDHHAADTSDRLSSLTELCEPAVELLEGRGELAAFGSLLHRAWELKRGERGVTNPHIDTLYQRARAAGALGGKLLGAGGAGFLLLFAEPETQPRIRAALADLHELSISLEPGGSVVQGL